MNFILIPAGKFTMGSPESETDHYSDETQREVTISAFEMQETQVTQKQWMEFEVSNPSLFEGDERPVERVSYGDVMLFIGRLNHSQSDYTYRLPTEEEWEYACRAGTKSSYSFGDDEKNLKDYAWFYKNSTDRTHSVATLKPNPWGLFDMHGNVWEWTSSFYSASGSSRVFRGGSWSNDARNLRSAYRNNAKPGNRNDDVGFRLARDKRTDSSTQSRETLIAAAMLKLKELEAMIMGLK